MDEQKQIDHSIKEEQLSNEILKLKIGQLRIEILKLKIEQLRHHNLHLEKKMELDQEKLIHTKELDEKRLRVEKKRLTSQFVLTTWIMINCFVILMIFLDII
ncbi:hypothetical protein [Hazenella coriacea]|uniref:Uncharacterized protein n=1 Tax=Hazenella coriacea TaxID=1179467 RepID=A0A4R3LBR3_9BACL|nr:hypothetical protein [Hazenella coriacea]TCS95744.1 hypothetical protein EDD58_102324 [Hazenella coriacea]